MSALDYNDNNQSDFTPTFPSTFSYTPSNQGAGITSVRTNPLVQNIIDSFKLGNTQIIPEFVKNKVVRIKLKEVSNQLKNIKGEKSIKDSHFISVLRTYDLIKEVANVIK